jgi:Family of unknown function (DUF6029)
MRFFYLILLFSCFARRTEAQNNARITGNLQSNGNFFIRDPRIGASGTPQYDNQKFGAENWLNLQYSNWGFDIGARFDLFNNSNLLNPNGSFTGEGIGRWFVQKRIDKFEFAGGYLYDQIGSGIIFRAYEERALLIDNALFGVKAAYNFNDNWRIKAFTGRQKRQFSTYGTVIRGSVLEGFLKPDSTKNFSLAPGAGVVARTYDNAAVDDIVKTIATYAPQDSTGAQYNTYAATFYNTLTAGAFSWYVEGAFKTRDVIFDPFARTATGGSGKLSNRKGYTFYTSVSYGKSGFGMTLEAKRTKDFSFRVNPATAVTGFQGALNFLPPLVRQNTYRLTARFAPATQELGEQAFQADLRYAVNKKLSLGLNVSDVSLLDGTALYREIAPELTWKQQRKWQLIGGLQLLRYNMAVYQGKDDEADPDDPLAFVGGGRQGYVDALTPYSEFLYRFTGRRSMRIEAQYLLTDDEFGSWINGAAEFGWAPHWLVFVSDMYKIRHKNPGEKSPDKTKFDGLHYPSIGVTYTKRANRFSLAYVKQVEGINCAGGICRYEPAFHGVKLNINSSF